MTRFGKIRENTFKFVRKAAEFPTMEYLDNVFKDKNLKEFAQTEEGSFYIDQQYHRYLQMYEEKQITAPMFYGKLVKEMATDLEGLY